MPAPSCGHVEKFARQQTGLLARRTEVSRDTSARSRRLPHRAEPGPSSPFSAARAAPAARSKLRGRHGIRIRSAAAAAVSAASFRRAWRVEQQHVDRGFPRLGPSSKRPRANWPHVSAVACPGRSRSKIAEVSPASCAETARWIASVVFSGTPPFWRNHSDRPHPPRMTRRRAWPRQGVDMSSRVLPSARGRAGAPRRLAPGTYPSPAEVEEVG